MMKPKKRLVKAKLKEDRFVIMTAQAEAWFEKHGKEALYGIIGIVVIAAIGIAVSWSKSASEEKAAFEELLARDAFARSEYDTALTRANLLTEDYSGTSAAGVALMIKGRIFEIRGQADNARKVFEEVIDDYSGEEYLAFGAYFGLATLSHGANDFSKAAETYERAASKYPKHFSAPVALLEAGKSYEKAGKLPQAKSAYRRVLSDYSKSRSADLARDNLAKLEFMP